MVMAETFDFKKESKELYSPKTKPHCVDVPEMLFLMVDGKGNPNTSKDYQNAVESLFGLSYTIKMSKKSGKPPEGYFEYAVAPLEGLWWTAEGSYDGTEPGAKERLHWTSMMRQPLFVTQEVLETAQKTLAQKKPFLNTSQVRLVRFTEGLCAQIMHIGPYDNEPATIAMMDAWLVEEGFRSDLSTVRKHHEIYLNDPNKTAPEKYKTVIRHPIAKE